jgi:oligopeptide/dipeptide ABC transporter ATP-binding protein
MLEQTQTNSDWVLELRGLTKRFITKAWTRKGNSTVYAVTDVNLLLKKGTTLSLVGESGCGKSTVGRMSVGLLQPTAGSITIDGVKIHELNPGERHRQKRKAQIIFQDPYASLNPRMTAGAVVAEPLRNYGYSSQDIQARVAKLFDVVGLNKSSIKKYPHEFSGGQRQRIGIARALALEPKLIICDEAVSALDVSVQAQIINLLMDLQRELGVSYLFIAHDLAVVKHISHDVAVMYLGRIVEQATKTALFANPAHPYTKALLGSVPKISTERRKEWNILKGEMPSPLNPPSGCAFRTRCPLAQPICAEQIPLLKQIGEDQSAACHFV